MTGGAWTSESIERIRAGYDVVGRGGRGYVGEVSRRNQEGKISKFVR
jgi:hypothetical protein